MDMLLRSHLLISFPQVGGRATELPSLGRRSGDALQPLQEQTHTDGLLPCLLITHRTSCEPKTRLPLAPHTEVSLLTDKHLASQKSSVCFVWTFSTSLLKPVLLGYPFLARTGKPQSSQLLALSEPHMLSKAREMLSRQDTPLLIDRAWSSYPDLPHNTGRQRRDAH